MGTPSSTSKSTAAADHGWFGSETIKTRLGTFAFTNSYPAGDSAQHLRDALVFNRAVEAYLVQMHGVSWYRVWKGVAEAGAGDAQSGRHLGEPDGRRDAPAHRQHRNRLRTVRHRPEA